jgi:hypothetical protein
VWDRREGRVPATDHRPLDVLDPTTWPVGFGPGGQGRPRKGRAEAEEEARVDW